jgi:predicted transcriptional regulator of viral defense system
MTDVWYHWGMAKAQNQAAKVKALAKAHGVLRPKDLAAKGIPRAVLSRLCAKGELTRTGRGLYVVSVENMTENHSFAEVSRQVPRGVICLLSALRFHELTTQLPSEVWLAIGPHARRPKGASVSLRPVHFSGPALTEGVEMHEIENVNVRIFSAAKTVADCFKHRNKIGIDVAMEALKECWKERKATADELWRFAKICRVSKIMQPYMEAIV